MTLYHFVDCFQSDDIASYHHTCIRIRTRTIYLSACHTLSTILLLYYSIETNAESRLFYQPNALVFLQISLMAIFVMDHSE